MLREAHELLDQPIDARDGHLGTVEDLFFDDQDWSVRYAVVRVGLPFRRERLFIQPGAIAKPDWPSPHLAVWLTKRQARSRVVAEPDLPDVGVPIVHHADRAPGSGAAEDAGLLEQARRLLSENTHLQSMREARSYRLSAREGSAGRVRDFIIDDKTWTVCHVEAEVDLLLGKKSVLVPPASVDGVDATGHAVRVGLTRHALGGAPRFQKGALMSRLYQMCVYDYYATATGTPLMRSERTSRPGTVDARMLLSTILD